MVVFGPIGFGAPWLLAGLLALPVLWVLLRAVPPAPIRRRFPAVVLLLGLKDETAQAQKTPWWLLLLRVLAVGAMIVGFAGPVVNPQAKQDGSSPVLVFIENGWASAADWSARISRVRSALEKAGQAGRPVAVVVSGDLPPEGLPFMAAGAWGGRLAGLAPVPWDVALSPAVDVITQSEAEFDTLWLSDGLAQAARSPLLRAFEAHGQVEVFQSPAARLGLRPSTFSDGVIHLTALRDAPGPARDVVVAGIGPDPSGTLRVLSQLPLSFAPDQRTASAQLSLPPELRNRITRFRIQGIDSAGAVSLADDSLRRRRVALLGGASGREGLELLSPLHFLHQALQPTADLLEGTLADLLRASPDVIILADVAVLSSPDQKAVAKWVAQGGLLLRFAGPRLAASDAGRDGEDILLPVRLRAGGRTVGGAMSWGEPRTLAPFSDVSPFFGLNLPEDVTVRAQVLAEPGPDLFARVIATLADGTPLVTRKTLGDGQIVLFHVSANAEWSTLPLSGLFMQMLNRLAVSTQPARPVADELKGTVWVAKQLLNGFGQIDVAGDRPGVQGTRLVQAPADDLPPGVYGSDDRRIAVNVIAPDRVLAPAQWPARISPVWGGAPRARDISGWVLALALGALALDIFASLVLTGRLRGAKGLTAGLVLITLWPHPDMAQAQAQDQVQDQALAVQDRVISAAANVTLAHVLTGDAQVDRVAFAGLTGLSDELFRRTSVEPAPPVGVHLETDELAVFALLYWPVIADQPLPSAETYLRLNRYLNAGGMILFDTRDGDVAGFANSSTPAAARLRTLARPLEIPALEPVPEDHVLTRAFYLLTEFPGRYIGRAVWVEAAPSDAPLAEGMPFRNLNDGVSPVVIGANDWAAAWAVGASGAPMFPVGRGLAGERQREMAFRFGVNLVMHVLTGNYKSDQVHVPALLERLGL